MSGKKIAILPGDGIGPEVMQEAIKVLNKIDTLYNAKFTYEYAAIGGIAIDNYGTALPKTTLKACGTSDAILLGAVGGEKWDKLPINHQPERAALLPLRKYFNLYANLQPALLFPQLKEVSPLKTPRLKEGFNFLIVREITSGIYYGTPKGKNSQEAFDTLFYTKDEIKRIAKIAFELAKKRKKKLASVDKANMLSSMVLWRETVNEVSKDFPEVELTHLHVDNAAMLLIKDPTQFDVMLCGNMFGEILSNEVSMFSGSLGMIPSASISDSNFGLYEPAGGAATDIAGLNIANPIAEILAAAMLVKYSFGMPEAGQRIFMAVQKVLAEGYRTEDIKSTDCKIISTKEMGNLISKNL